MKNYLNTETIRWLLLIIGIGLVVELTLFTHPLTIFFAAAAIYLGLKLRPHLWGTILLVVGIFTAAGIVMKLNILKIIIIFLILHFFYQYYWKTKKEPHVIKVETTQPANKATMVKKEPFIKNSLFGNKKIGTQVYEMDDINIHTGIGDTIIDLSMTMLPQGESMIVIRGLVGNIKLLVPYDVDVYVNHSVFVGKINIFDVQEEGFNKNCIYVSKEYSAAARKLKILTSIVVGDIEVRNI
ncbi:cell wall-active antibiotics response protein [Bacillus aquiflavi]|uniref:Cell wall-active antibiotics response protein n=1 Tax=Bacillus aquiflavi TaxID=2672567 RepID=A0A6B3VWQ8_9BACI|nr:cell wall-active antibiotics response protein LiaF [Bacillus aquiflavi]MBA4535575.1 cell wall-active antibiotics response protein [Bacillus aquiflavi]NEY79951.1 cell wall-active antibiotics response protein [Bacillus aquiflavi]UAC48894.1 cell wall-active antibiotics response protein [Bacillus aquiflavi]